MSALTPSKQAPQVSEGSITSGFPSGVSGNIEYKVQDGICYLNYTFTGLSSASTTMTGILPSVARPKKSIERFVGIADYSSATLTTGLVTSGGNFRIEKASGYVTAMGSAVYPTV